MRRIKVIESLLMYYSMLQSKKTVSLTNTDAINADYDGGA